MAKTRVSLLLFLLPALLPESSWAVAQDSQRSLTWEDCVTISSRSSPDLFSAKRALEASKAAYYGSFNSFLPKLSLSDSYQDSDNFGHSSGSNPFLASSDTSNGPFHWELAGTVSANLFSASNLATIRTALAGVAQADANLHQVSANLRFNLRQAFAQLLFSQESIEVSKTILQIRERDSQLVALRYQSGRESKGNKMKTDAQFLQAQADVDQAVRNLRTAQISLARQMGSGTFALEGADGVLATNPTPDLPREMQGILAARPDVTLQEAVVQSAKASLLQATSSLLPNITTSYTRSFDSDIAFPTENASWAFSAALNYPLFAGGPTATLFATVQAKRNVEKSQQDLRAVRDQARVDLETAWAAFSNAVDQVKVRTALLEAARQRNAEADIRYESGLLSYENWEIIVSERVDAERLALQAQVNAVVAEAAWQKALGKGLGDQR